MPAASDPLPTLPTLNGASEALRRGERAAALEALLDAWRASRASAIAELVDTLSQQLEAERSPLALVGSSKQEAWLDALEQATTVDLPRLYEALPDTRVGLAKVRLTQLSTRPPDPRLSRWLWAWIRDVPFSGTAARGFYVEAGKLLLALADSRFDADILAAESSDSTTGHYTVARLRAVGRTALAAFRELADAARQRTVPELDPQSLQRIEQLDAAIRASAPASEQAEQTEASLLAAVHADPGNDDPRLVYADFLQRRGDPRGEFIALQIARHGTENKPSKQERALLKQYGHTWTDGLEPFILASGREFRRGFLAAVRYCHPRIEPDPIGVPAWATIEELDGGAHKYTSGTARIVLQPHVTQLRMLRGVTHEDVEQLAAHDRALAIEHLHLRRSDTRLLATLQRAKSLPRLQALDLHDAGLGPDEVAAIAAGLPGVRVIC